MPVVFRVQNAQGRGPWIPGWSHTWVEDRPDHDYLVPWYVEMGPVHLQMTPGMHGGTACASPEQLRRWFTRGEYLTLKRYGFQAVKLEVDRILGQSDIQLFFERRRPLQAGAITIPLYPKCP